MPKVVSTKKTATAASFRSRGPDPEQIANSGEARAIADVIGLAMCFDGAISDEEVEPSLEYAVTYITAPYSEDLTPRSVEAIRDVVRDRFRGAIDKVNRRGFAKAYEEIIGNCDRSNPNSLFDAAMNVLAQDSDLSTEECSFLASLAGDLNVDLATCILSVHANGWSAGWDQGWESAKSEG